MKFLCEYHQRNPDQTGSMQCEECNRCECGNVYYSDINNNPLGICPKCGEEE